MKISTDGKILIIGQLNFAADNLSISGRLYADLSKVTQGDVTVLFLADVPDQVRVLTLYGKLQMGFRNAAGRGGRVRRPRRAAGEPDGRASAGPRAGDTISQRRAQRPRLHRRRPSRSPAG